MVEDYTQGKKLTYAELVNILAILAVKIQKLEKTVGSFYQLWNENTEFQTEQILKTRLKGIEIDKLDKTLKNFIAYYHKELPTKKAKSAKPYKGIEN